MTAGDAESFSAKGQCPICWNEMTSQILGSSRFESGASVMKCEKCGFECPRSTPSIARISAFQTVESAAQLKNLSLPTKAQCPFCSTALAYLARKQCVECMNCSYQEHWPQESVSQIL